MALGDLLIELVASAMPGPATDRSLAATVLFVCGIATAMQVSWPYLIDRGIVPADWVPDVIACVSVAGAAAIVLGALFLYRRTAGVVLPIACIAVGVTGCYAAWFL